MFLGVDGCPGGWYVTSTTGGSITGRVYQRFSDILSETPAPSVIAVDIPIGLTTRGSRQCDVLTRRALAPRRSASVFPAPLRSVLNASSHSEASAIRRAVEGKGMSLQSFGITRKVQEVDLALDAYPDHLESVYEVHPELCFTQLNGGVPMCHAKKTPAGRGERLDILRDRFGDTPARLLEHRVPRDVGADDVLDALVALWSAMRIGNSEHVSLPAVPEQDAHGRRMAIFY